MLLRAEEDVCNEEGGGSGEGRWRDGKSIFTLSEECSQEEGEERRASITLRKTSEQHQTGKLAFGICCPSSQNKTRPLEVTGVGGHNQTSSPLLIRGSQG